MWVWLNFVYATLERVITRCNDRNMREMYAMIPESYDKAQRMANSKDKMTELSKGIRKLWSRSLGKF